MNVRTLEDRLETIREGAKKRIAAEHREQMSRATAELKASAAAEAALGVGDRAPLFELPDSQASPVVLSDLLERGPLVLTFFRGHW